MYGAVIGDLAGSIYEYNQTKKIKSVRIDKIINEKAFYSDDTILTIAIIDAILNNGDYDLYLKKYINKYKNYHPSFSPYFKNAFSKSIIDWSNEKNNGTSQGNGALMRISPVGYMFDNELDIINNVILATSPTHNSKEAISSSIKLALMIYYFRKGLCKEEVYKKLDIKLDFQCFKKFNTTCDETLSNCLYVLYYSNSFIDSIKNTLLMGGDTDTNAAIVGSVAEALYGIPKELVKESEEKIPSSFVKVLRKAKVKDINNR